MAAVGLVVLPLPPFASLASFSPRGVIPPDEEEPDEGEGVVVLPAAAALLFVLVGAVLLAGGSRSNFGSPFKRKVSENVPDALLFSSSSSASYFLCHPGIGLGWRSSRRRHVQLRQTLLPYAR